VTKTGQGRNRTEEEKLALLARKGKVVAAAVTDNCEVGFSNLSQSEIL